MEGQAFAFINRNQALRFGHVGWGFCVDARKGLYYFGSTDHLYRHPWWDLPGWVRYAHVKPELDNDWWSGTGTYDQMMTAMSTGHHLRYHAAKLMVVGRPDPDRAVAAAEALARGGWSVLANNCVHQTYQVLTEYGAGIPPPSQPLTNLIPRVWFARLEGEQVDLGAAK
jgi:hypothetical protein